MTNRRPLCLVLIVLLVLSATFISQKPALAASPLCQQYGCDYEDPYAMRCAGSGASYGVVGMSWITNKNGKTLGYVQIWYSWTCGANWGRIVKYDNGWAYGVGVATERTNNYYGLARNRGYSIGGGVDWRTTMLYAPYDPVGVCGWIDEGDPERTDLGNVRCVRA